MAKSKTETVLAMLNPFPSDIERAQAEVSKIEKLREDLTAERARAEQELSLCRLELPAAEVDERLNPAETKPSSALVANIQASEAIIARCDRSLKLLTSKHAAALTAVAEAEACQIEREADKVSKQLDVHCRDVDAAMRKLCELEGSTFVSAYSHQRQVLELTVATGAGKTMPAQVVAVPMPRSVQLATQLSALREQAAQRRRQAGAVRSHGQVSGYGIDELLAELRAPGIVGPAESAVRAWFSSTMEAATAKEENWKRFNGSTPYRLVWLLVWRDGVIDQRASCVSCEEQSAWRTGPISQRTITAGPAYGH